MGLGWKRLGLLLMALSLAQAQWLVRFMKNLPGQQAQSPDIGLSHQHQGLPAYEEYGDAVRYEEAVGFEDGYGYEDVY